MKEIFKYIVFVAVAAVMWSCDDDLGIVDKGDTITFTIDASATFSDTDSRAVFADGDEKNITKYCLLVYDGTSNSSKLIESVDITSLPTTLTLPSPGAGNYRAIMIANSQLSELKTYATKGSSTLDDLNNATFAVSSHYNIPGGGSDPDVYAPAGAATNFTWSGYVDYTGSTRSMFFNLRPNMAKLTVTVENKTKSNTDPKDKIKIVNLQIKNVRNRVLHAQNALSDMGDGYFVEQSEGDMGVLDYNIEKLELAPDESKTRQYYIPHNMVNAGGKVRPNAPTKATYIEVDGIRNFDFMDIAYKVYLGSAKNGNPTGDYHVQCDHKYTVNITITNDGLDYNISSSVNQASSGKSTEPEKIVLPSGNNCYMIHPKISNKSGGIVYELPIDQINRFWGHKLWYTGEANEINDNTEWVAEVIWQDQNARVIHFCDENGNYTTSTHNSYNGKGKKPFYFKLDQTTIKNPISNPSTDIYGNVLVGVRLKSETDNRYLWSWHLWVTDYNPDAVPPPSVVSAYKSVNTNGLYVQNGDFEVDKQGYYWLNNNIAFYSNVQHYSHVNSHYWGTSSSPSASAKVWDYGGMYSDKWIMDRNLGSHSPNNLEIVYPTEGFGLYYQFGRKDPFPYKTVYDISGATTVKKWDVGTNVGDGTLSNGVLRPYRFYKGSTSMSWAKDATSQSNSSWHYWYSLTQINKGEKSIFDPCPPGWCVPIADTFDFMLNSYNTNNIYKYGNSNTILQSLRAVASIYFDTDIYDDGPQRNMAIVSSVGYITASDLECLDTTFPLQGNIAGESGSVVNIGYNFSDYGCIWTCESADGISGTLFQFKASSGGQQSSLGEVRDSGRTINRYTGPVVHKENWIAARAQPVRCIQEPNL